MRIDERQSSASSLAIQQKAAVGQRLQLQSAVVDARQLDAQLRARPERRQRPQLANTAANRAPLGVRVGVRQSKDMRGAAAKRHGTILGEAIEETPTKLLKGKRGESGERRRVDEITCGAVVAMPKKSEIDAAGKSDFWELRTESSQPRFSIRMALTSGRLENHSI